MVADELHKKELKQDTSIQRLVKCHFPLFVVFFLSLVSLYLSDSFATAIDRNLRSSWQSSEQEYIHTLGSAPSFASACAMSNCSTGSVSNLIPINEATTSWSLPLFIQGMEKPLPLPIQVMEQYIREHSVEALRADPHPERRKYALALYQCPKSAGNMMKYVHGLFRWLSSLASYVVTLGTKLTFCCLTVAFGTMCYGPC